MLIINSLSICQRCDDARVGLYTRYDSNSSFRCFGLELSFEPDQRIHHLSRLILSNRVIHLISCLRILRALFILKMNFSLRFAIRFQCRST